VLQAAGPAQIEAVLLNSKLELVSSKIRKGVILYVEFVTETVSRIKKFVEALGFSVGTFTGQAAKRDEDLHSFIAGRTDVLIASSAIRVGVDGLQQRCNRLVLLGTPWTSSDWDQLVGRVDRQGSKFDHVEVVHPQINISAGGQKWSWDEIRLSTIKAKRTLANTVLDGVLMNTETISHSELTKSAIASLQRMQQAVELSAA
jgi:superfamily II DNA/RNA helicase